MHTDRHIFIYLYRQTYIYPYIHLSIHTFIHTYGYTFMTYITYIYTYIDTYRIEEALLNGIEKCYVCECRSKINTYSVYMWMYVK